MNKYTKLALPIFIGLLASCSAEEDSQFVGGSENPASGKRMIFSACIDADVTRTHQNGTKTVWSENDAIWIFNASKNNNNKGKFTLTGGKDSGSGTFEAETTIDANEGEDANDFYSFYPYNDKVTFSYTNKVCKVSASIPAEQEAKENLFETGYQYMTAYTKGANLSFKNVVSYFKVTVKSSDAFPISRIKIVANNSTGDYEYLNIAGTFTSAINAEGQTAIANADIASGSSFVTTTITPSNEAHTYYLAVLPTSAVLNFTLLLESNFSTTTHDQKIYQATKQGLTFAAGKIYDLGEFDAATLGSKGKVLDNVVDLDLPSGTIWCNKDLGSDAVGTPGPYMMWGQIQNSEGKIVEMTTFTDAKYGTLTNLKYKNNNNKDVTKYSGTNTENVGELGTDDDAVYIANNKFALPTYSQARELTRSKNTSPIVDPTFTNCCRVQNKAGNRYIVLNKVGRKLDNAVGYTNRASYWSKTRQKENNTNAYWYDFNQNGTTYTGRIAGEGGAEAPDPRFYGRLYRGVVVNKNIAPVKTYEQLKGGN